MSVLNIGHGNKIRCGGATGVAELVKNPPTVRCLVACPDVRSRHSTKPKITRIWGSLTYRIRLCSVLLVLRHWEFGDWQTLSNLKGREISYCTDGYIWVSSR